MISSHPFDKKSIKYSILITLPNFCIIQFFVSIAGQQNIAEIMTDRYLKDQSLYQQASTSDSTPLRRKCLPNELHILETVPRTLFVPIYIRVCNKDLVNVSLKDQRVYCHFQIFITFPTNLSHDLFEKLGSKQIENSGKLIRFLRNNLMLQISDQFIDIVNEPEEIKPRIAPIERSTAKTRLRFKDSTHYLTTFQVQDKEDEQPYNQEFFYLQMKNIHSSDYISYLIQGNFKCKNELINHFFPYHQISAALTINVHQLCFKDVNIRYNIFNLNQEDEQFAQLFLMQLENRQKSSFGIYTLSQNYHKITWKGTEEDIEHETDEKVHEVILVDSISFGFLIFSYNLPFILRYEIPIWMLCVASILLYFTSMAGINNVFGNVILLSVAEISLMCNFRMSSYSTSTPSLYQSTLNGFILMLFMLIIHQTEDFYNDEDNIPNNSNYRSYFFQITILLAGILLIVNVVCLSFWAVKSKMASKRKQEICFKEDLKWNQTIFKNCVSFDMQMGEEEEKISDRSSKWYEYDD